MPGNISFRGSIAFRSSLISCRNDLIAEEEEKWHAKKDCKFPRAPGMDGLVFPLVFIRGAPRGQKSVASYSKSASGYTYTYTG